MIHSSDTTAEEAIRSLLDDGWTVGELQSVVATMERQKREAPTGDNQRIYAPNEVPEGLVTLAEAEKITSASRRRIGGWIEGGLMHPRGRVRAPARGGGYILVALADVQRILQSPPKRGRRLNP